MKFIQSKRNRILPYIISCGLVFLTTLFGELVKKRLEPTNIVMFYLLAVVLPNIAGRLPYGIASRF